MRTWTVIANPCLFSAGFFSPVLLLLFTLITLKVREWLKLKPQCGDFENSSL